MSKKTKTTETKHEKGFAMERYRKNIIQLLSKLIRIPSVKGAPAKNAPFGRILLGTLKVFLSNAAEQGFRTAELDGKVGYLEFGPEDAPLIAAVCHLDVVPPGHWPEAFLPKVTDTKIIGRGSADNKGPAVAVFYALKALKDAGYQPKCRLRLILGLDEESGSQCMAHYCEHAELPVAAFTPDANFPVISAEKGIIGFKIHYEEPEIPMTANGLFLTAMEGGTKENVVPELCRYDLRDQSGKRSAHSVNGKAAHASTPEEGQNAISTALWELKEQQISSEFIQWYTENIGFETNGKSLGIQVSDEVSGELTLNIGLVKFDGKTWTLSCDLRYPVTTDGTEFLSTIQQSAAAIGGSINLGEISHALPLNLPHEHPLVRTLTEVYNEQTGSALRPIGIGGGTYARALPNTVAFGAVFPGETVNMHQNDEQVSIESLLRASNIYRSAFLKLDSVYGAAKESEPGDPD
ncbi:MAG: Sapep family Mn(2+)-dependent dipeptidase [Fastidiosipilaceae bacterium]|jgi:succinyl-diaminopimelate desuccinylase